MCLDPIDVSPGCIGKCVGVGDPIRHINDKRDCAAAFDVHKRPVDEPGEHRVLRKFKTLAAAASAIGLETPADLAGQDISTIVLRTA